MMTSAHLRKVAIRTLDESLAALVDELLAVLHFRLHRLQFVVTLAVLSCKHQHTPVNTTCDVTTLHRCSTLKPLSALSVLISWNSCSVMMTSPSALKLGRVASRSFLSSSRRFRDASILAFVSLIFVAVSPYDAFFCASISANHANSQVLTCYVKHRCL